MRYKVMIVDDQSISRQLLEFIVKETDNYEVMCSISSAGVADIYMLKYKIDLILMDILMNDGSNGLETARLIKDKYPHTKIIAITSMPEYSWINKAKSYKIDSFWYKEGNQMSIKDVMDATMNGESIYPEKPLEIQLGLASSYEFSQRELDVLRLITTGISNGSIAKELGISENTVKTHVRHMLDKTGFKSRTELAIQARLSGLTIY